MKKMYSICALVGMVFFSDACWGGAFMDALKKIGENSAVTLGDGFFWFDDSKAKDPKQKERLKKTKELWSSNYKSLYDAEVMFDIGGPCHSPCLRIGKYEVMGTSPEGKVAIKQGNRMLEDSEVSKRITGALEDNCWEHIVIADEELEIYLDFYWNSDGTVIVKDASVKSIAIHANFVHFLGDNHFGKATIAAPSGCTFWGSTTTANDLKIYSHSIAKLGGFLGGEKYRRPYDKKSLTESELDDFVTTCPDYMTWLERYVYGSDVGFLNIGGRFNSDEVKTEDISFNIDGDTEIKKSLTQSGKNNKTIIRSRGDLALIALQWLGYFTDESRHWVNIEKFIGTKSIKIAKQNNIGYSETIEHPENYNKMFHCNSHIDSIYRLYCEGCGDGTLYYRNMFSDFRYEDGEPVDSNDLQISDYPISVRYDRENLWFKLKSEKQYQFWFEFNKLPIYFGPDANSRLNALFNFQVYKIYDNKFKKADKLNSCYMFCWTYDDRDGQDEDDSDDDNEVAEPEVAPASSADGDKNDDNEVAEPEVSPVTSSNNNEDYSGENPIIGMPGADHALGVNREYFNKIKQKKIASDSEPTQNGESNMPPEENASPISHVDFSEEKADDED